jgi:hypothetical protein
VSSSPWNLAWHPRAGQDHPPDKARFEPPACTVRPDDIPRITGGLWTSPLLKLPQLGTFSMWSILHDREGYGSHSSQAWEIAWPHESQTAVIDSLKDLQDLVERYPCTAHRRRDTWGLICGHRHPWETPDKPEHDEMNWPVLDFAKLAADGYTALHVTVRGHDATWQTKPGTTAMGCETVLWLAPEWNIIGPVQTQVWPFEDEG